VEVEKLIKGGLYADRDEAIRERNGDFMFENKLRIRGGVRDARRTEMVCLFSKGIRGI